MKCPYCSHTIKPTTVELPVGMAGKASIKSLSIYNHQCPQCEERIIELVKRERDKKNVGGKIVLAGQFVVTHKEVVYPRKSRAKNFETDVPQDILEDYSECCDVLEISPKASAALSRRCLQNILKSFEYITKKNLADQIDQFIEKKEAPPYILESVDAVRNIGNFAAHPNKSNSSGEILKVEPGEAEWSIDVLEAMIDFTFVQPKLLRIKKEELNKKLQDSGKPALK